MYPVKIVRVLAAGALVLFSDGSTRLVEKEAIDAWTRFGIDVTEGNVSPEAVERYKLMLKISPWNSGISEKLPWSGENVTEVLEGTPEVVPEVAAPVVEERPSVADRIKGKYTDFITPPEEDVGQTPPYTGHFGPGWLPDFGENLKWGWQRHLQDQARRKADQKTWIEVLDELPASELAKKPEDRIETKVDKKPRSIKAAQAQNSIYWWDKNNKKKLALTAGQLATFELSKAYKEDGGSALRQAANWLNKQTGAINFEKVGGDPQKVLTGDWMDTVALPDAEAAPIQVRVIDEAAKPTIKDLESELDSIQKQRDALNAELELGTSPGWQAPIPLSRIGEPVIKGGVGDFGTAVSHGVPSLDEGMEEGYMYASPGEAAVAGLIPRMTLPAGGVGDFATVPFPSQAPSLDEIYPTQPSTIVPKEYADAILPTDDMSPQTISNLSVELQDALISGEGLGDAFIKAQQEKLKEPLTWEERYPLAPQGQWPGEVDTGISGLADSQWDPHPLASNVSMGAWYGLPLDVRDKIYKARRSTWDPSKLETRVEVPEVEVPISEVEVPMSEVVGETVYPRPTSLASETTAAVDQLLATEGKNIDAYGDELPPGSPSVTSVPSWGGGRPSGPIKPIESDYRYGYHDKYEGWTPETTERAGDWRSGLTPEQQKWILGDPSRFELYQKERWYLTKSKFFAKNYKKSDLVQPWESRPADFFGR